MKVIIVEDEQLAVERLQLLLLQYDPQIRVLAALESVAGAVKWLSTHAASDLDLILLDIQLADGSAFEIFKQVKVTTPVIFTTAYDQYALDAFKEFSIDYLLKPVTLPALSQAIGKMIALRQGNSLQKDYRELASQLLTGMPRYKTRFLGKIGQKIYFVETHSVAYFQADNKIVCLVAMDNSRYTIDHTLEELESQLNPALFFRINRSMIVHAGAIDQVKPYINSRLRVLLKSNLKAADIFISRERVAAFKKWADS